MMLEKSTMMRILLLALASLSLNVHAFTYDEDTSGDIAGSTTQEPLFIFDEGTNSVSGKSEVYWLNDSNGNRVSDQSIFDFDNFAFTILDGYQLDSVQYSFWDVNKSGTDTLGLSNDIFSFIGYSFYTPFNPDANIYFTNTGQSGTLNLFPETVPIQSGSYRWSSGFITDLGSPLQVGGGSWSYSIDYNVSKISYNVPEPTSLLLFSLGLLGLRLIRK